MVFSLTNVSSVIVIYALWSEIMISRLSLFYFLYFYNGFFICFDGHRFTLITCQVVIFCNCKYDLFSCMEEIIIWIWLSVYMRLLLLIKSREWICTSCQLYCMIIFQHNYRLTFYNHNYRLIFYNHNYRLFDGEI